MNNYKELTQEKFDALLSWLSPNRDVAGENYEKIRQSLGRFFYFKGCPNFEDLTDETINRVIGKLSLLDETAGNKPITIFFGFANNVYLEYLKSHRHEVSLDEAKNLKTITNEGFSETHNALDECLKALTETERSLVVEYYLGDKSQKFANRRNLADRLNLSMGAMHIKLHRLRQKLRICIEKKLETK